MPPQMQQKPRDTYTKTTGFFTRLKVLLDLIISDLLRLIFAVILFAVICAIAVGAFFYQKWLPQVESYVVSLSMATSTSASTPTK